MQSVGFARGKGLIEGNTLKDVQFEFEKHDFDPAGMDVIIGNETDHFTGTVSGGVVTLSLDRAESRETLPDGTLIKDVCTSTPAPVFTSTITPR